MSDQSRRRYGVLSTFKIATLVPASNWVVLQVNVYQQIKFLRHISIHGRDIMLPFWKSKRPPYWHSTSGFDFGYITAIGMPICIRLLNFIQTGPYIVEILRHFHFSRWQMQQLNTTSGFVFVDVTAFRRSKSISKPNLVDISQCTAEI